MEVGRVRDAAGGLGEERMVRIEGDESMQMAGAYGHVRLGEESLSMKHLTSTSGLEVYET
jgi:hypothetical protein